MDGMAPLRGWDAAWACHEAGHAVMLLWHGWDFQYIETRSPDPGCWAKVVGLEYPVPDPRTKIIRMKVSAAGPIAERRFSYPRRPMLSEEQLAERFDQVAAEEQTDHGMFKRVGEALDAQLLEVNPGHLGDRPHWPEIWFLVEEQIRGPLWPVVEGLASVMMDQTRNCFPYDEVSAITAPLFAEVAL